MLQRILFHCGEMVSRLAVNQLFQVRVLAVEFIMNCKELFPLDQLPEFKPAANYHLIGDFISCFFSGEDAVEERLTDNLLVYRSKKTGEVVGCKITNIQDMLPPQKSRC